MNYKLIANNLSEENIISLLKFKEENLNLKEQFRKEISKIQTELEQANQLILWFKKQFFGKKSEKRIFDDALPLDATQTSFIPEPEAKEEQVEESDVEGYKRGKAKKKKLENAVTETGLRFNSDVPVEVIKIENPEIKGLTEEEYKVIGTKKVHKLAQNPCTYKVLCYEQDVIKILETESTEQKICSLVPVPSVFDKSFADVSFLANMLVDKFLYHMPFYRQEQKLKSSGILVGRSTIISLFNKSIELLTPIYNSQVSSIISGSSVSMDEVPIKAGVNKAKKQMKRGYFWPTYGELNEVAFHYSDSRKESVIKDVLGEDFKGVLLTDGYAAYASYSEKLSEVTHALCWSHSRRKFIEAENIEPKLCEVALKYIRDLYKIEEKIRGKDLNKIQEIRGRESKQIVEEFFLWLKNTLAEQTLLPSSPFTKALKYCLERESGLKVYLSNPDISMDTNHVERQIRPVVIGRKNWLFCFSEAGAVNAGIIFSLIATCKLHNINPYTYLVDVLQRVSSHSQLKVNELTPRVWKTKFADNPLRSDIDFIK